MRLRLSPRALRLRRWRPVPGRRVGPPRMLIGFQDDPSLRWRDDRLAVWDLAQQAGRRDRAHDRLLVAHRGDQARERRQPFDPAYRFDDLDEFVRNAGLHGMEVMLTIWGTPHVGERRQGPELRADQHERHAELREGGRLPLLGPVQRLPVRPLLLGLERVEPRPVPLAAVRLEGQAGGAGDLREALPRRVRRDQGGQLPLAGRRRRDLGARPRPLPRQAGHAGDRVARQVRASCSRSRSRAEVRRLVAPPVSDLDQRQADRRTSAGRTSPSPRCRGSRSPSRSGSRSRTSRSGSPSTATRRSPRSRRASPTRSRPPTCGRRSPIAARDPNVAIFIWFIVRDDPTSAWQSGLVQRNGVEEARLRRLPVRRQDRTTGANPQIFVKGGRHEPGRQVRGARALVALRPGRQGRHDDRDLRQGQGDQDGPARVGDRPRRLGLVPRAAHHREGPRLPDRRSPRSTRTATGSTGRSCSASFKCERAAPAAPTRP